MKSIYETPQITGYEITMEGFLCNSVDTVTATLSVDQYEDFDEETL